MTPNPPFGVGFYQLCVYFDSQHFHFYLLFVSRIFPIRFLLLGSHWGVVHLLDAMGNSLPARQLQAHTITVNQVEPSIAMHGDIFSGVR